MSSSVSHATTNFDESQLTERYVSVGDVRLHVVEAGKGPLVVLLHGFPEFWYSWKRQIPALVAAGFRVVVPDQRGYNLSDKPRGVNAYGVGSLADDVAGLIRECGEERASVVAHDWGAGVAWVFAMRHPEMLDRLAILNGPHPERMMRALRTFKQLRKSWYMFFFQIPRLPEWVLRRNGFAMLKGTFKNDPIERGTFDEADIQRYVEAFLQPEALTSAINWYRAAFRPGLSVPTRPVDAPVLVIWGEEDRYLGREIAMPDPKLVPNVRVEYIPHTSHWVQAERPQQVNALLTQFLRE